VAICRLPHGTARQPIPDDYHLVQFSAELAFGGFNVARKLDRITINPAVMNGQPCIRGMRLTVRRVVEAAALYPDRDELKGEYPELEDEDIAQALDFAARNLDDQILPLEAA
jgi:uncharacterized protein (DUF433 family)